MLAQNGQLPDVAAIEAEAFAPILRDHYDDVEEIFGSRISDQMPADVAATDAEDAATAAALLVLFDERAPSQAERIGRTSEKNARRAVQLANAESARITEEEGRIPTLQEESLIAGALLARQLRGRTSRIVTLETQAPSEMSKLMNAFTLLDLSRTLRNRGGSGDKPEPGDARIPQSWVTQGDNLVRTDPGTGHLGADGQTRFVGEAFDVGGQRLMYPGDTSLGATQNNVAGCRCAAVQDTGKIVTARRARPEPEVEEPTSSAPARATRVDDPTPTAGVRGPDLDAETSLGKWADPSAPTGFLPERAALHADILDDFARGAVPKQQKTLQFIGGGTASGKGTLKGSGKISTPTKSINVDSDAIKEKFPEFRAASIANDPKGASFVQKESTAVVDQLLERGRRDGVDVVFDATGAGGLAKIKARIQPFRDAGYRVNADFVTVPTDVAVARAHARGVEGVLLPNGKRAHRFVPEPVTREIHASVSQTFPQAARADLFDEARLWDTDIALGDDPILIFSRIEGVETIHDVGKWEAFLAKGAE